MSVSKPAVRVDVAGWVPGEHIAAARLIATTMANRPPRPARARMERSFYDHANLTRSPTTPTIWTLITMGRLGLPQLVTLFAAILVIRWIFNRRGVS